MNLGLRVGVCLSLLGVMVSHCEHAPLASQLRHRTAANKENNIFKHPIPRLVPKSPIVLLPAQSK